MSDNIVLVLEEEDAKESEETVSYEKFQLICRVCLKSGELFFIGDMVFGDRTILDLLKICASIKYQEDLPQHMCSACLTDLVRCFNFIQKCIRSDMKLKSIKEQRITNKDFEKLLDSSVVNKVKVENDCNGKSKEDDYGNNDKFKDVIDVKKDNDDDTNDLNNTHDPVKVDDLDKANSLEGKLKDIKDDFEESTNNLDDNTNNNLEHNVNDSEDSPDNLEDNLDEKLSEDSDSIIVKTKGKPTTREFTCDSCTETFPSRKALLDHKYTSNHPKTKSLPCPIQDCYKVFAKKIYLRHHVNIVHLKLMNHKCTICEKLFRSKARLNEHLRSHTKEKPFPCQFCSKPFGTKENLIRHERIHTGERPYICKVCGKGFSQSSQIPEHMKSHERKEKVKIIENELRQCPDCGQSFRNFKRYTSHCQKHLTGTQNLPTIKESQDFVCDVCGKCYATTTSLKQHKQYFHRESTFLCNECGRRFKFDYQLESHQRVHSGEKPFVCTVCDAKFNHITTLNVHALKHKGLRPHKCTICYKSFTQIAHFLEHKRIHSGERPFACTHCDKKFTQRGNLTVHIRMHTGERPYLCEVCNRGFSDSSALKTHVKNIH